MAVCGEKGEELHFCLVFFCLSGVECVCCDLEGVRGCVKECVCSLCLC